MENSAGHLLLARNKGKAPAGMGLASENIHLNKLVCKNVSCRAVLCADSVTCRHCSCHICGLYDENKDLSLWIVCEPDSPEYDSCRKKFHIECALKGGCMGVGNTGPFMPRDATFWCTSCGNISDILGCWKKQLSIAKDAQLVDDLCYRVSLSYRLLKNTLMYKGLHATVTEAKSKLEVEFGPIDGVFDRVGWGIVGSSSAHDVQKLCADAIEMASSPQWAPDHRVSPFSTYGAGDTGWSLSNLMSQACQSQPPTEEGGNTLGVSEAKCFTKGAVINHRNPDPPGTVGSADENPCPELNPHDTRMSSEGTREANGSPSGHNVPIPSPGIEQDCGPSERTTEANGPPSTVDVTMLSVHPEQAGRAEGYPNAGIEQVCGPSERTTGYEAGDFSHPRPITPLMDLNAKPLPDLNQDPTPPSEPSPAEDNICLEPDIGNDNVDVPSEPSPAEDNICLEPDIGNDDVDVSRGIQVNDQNHDPLQKSSSPNEGNCSPIKTSVQSDNQRYLECVQTIRGLEREGHIPPAFRLKFLSWFSFKSTEQEKRVVYSYFQVLSDDRQSLGEQLVHSFTDIVFGQAQT